MMGWDATVVVGTLGLAEAFAAAGWAASVAAVAPPGAGLEGWESTGLPTAWATLVCW